MKRFSRFLVVGRAAVFTSHLDAAPAHSIRVVLPSGADGLTKYAGEVLTRQIAKRCDVAVRPDGAADLPIELTIEKGIPPEWYRISQAQQSTLTGSEVSCVPAGGHEVFGYLGVMTIVDPSTFHGYTDSLQAYIDGVRSLGHEYHWR